VRYDPRMIAASYKPKKKFMQLAIAEAKRARDRGDYAIGAVIGKQPYEQVTVFLLDRPDAVPQPTKE
jgi:hypothetical protein